MTVRLIKRLGYRRFPSSDKFYVWTVRRSNYRNDRIWARSIEENQRYHEIVKNQSCIAVFIMFTCKRLLWAIKDKDES